MSQLADAALQTVRPAAHLRPASWFLRQTLIGVFALSVFVIGGACLLYASIEPDGASVAEQAASQTD